MSGPVLRGRGSEMLTYERQMPPGWYPDPMQAGHQREWNGQQWIGPSVPVGGQEKRGFPKVLIPVFACLALAFVAVVGGALAGTPEDEVATVRADQPTTTEPATTTSPDEAAAETEEPATEPATTEPATTAAPTTEAPTTAPPVTEPEREQYEGQDLYRVGETATSGDFDITVHTVEDPYISTNQFEVPPDGQRFVAVEITITNNTSEAEPFSSLLNVEVKDSENRVWDAAFAGFDRPQLDGQVAPGASVRGWVTFGVGSDVTGLVMRIRGNLTATGSVFALG
ncbi:DUF4352 domain-containing protein [Iamia sp. SCSIO 61187]|uniref:DUF4352 domain-containing protein n=1 Tax=Iamia sp. SCSIO 61187 TaxID=2722752 RepID=UPI001C635F71|nr:DUF4352 domain-containing protein [Iamia sp. SCSIO 61187]QYG92748.1 DUF4352 domain-containing protein [Iamia sp. SCSIO 61187]